jgi:hypothetical protein
MERRLKTYRLCALVALDKPPVSEVAIYVSLNGHNLID